MKTIWFAGAVVALVTACATGSYDTADKAEAAKEVSFSEAGLTALDAQMKQFVNDRNVYGIHTRLVQGGEVISETQYGLRNIETRAPIESDTIYRIYSMSKPITGVAMMQLYEQGKWKLDDPVTKYVPEFRGLRVLAGQSAAGEWQYEAMDRAPTMREVMSHTAGFGYGLAGDDPANKAFRDNQILRSPDLNTMIDRIAAVPLTFQPGEKWAYSAAVDIQGAIVERISGKSFGEYLDENIFTPLGMDDTAFYVPAEKYGRLSQVFGYHPETKQFGPVPFPTVMFKKETIALESGGGGLTSTMDDYAAFSQMLLNGGSLKGANILKPETVELMRTNILPEDMAMWSTGEFSGYDASGLGFGLDFGIITDPAAREANYGQGTFFWGGAAGTWFWVDPVNDLYFIGMIQRFGQNAPEEVDFRTTSAKLVYDAIAE